jgi:hypothetical protein
VHDVERETAVNRLTDGPGQPPLAIRRSVEPGRPSRRPRCAWHCPAWSFSPSPASSTGGQPAPHDDPRAAGPRTWAVRACGAGRPTFIAPCHVPRRGKTDARDAEHPRPGAGAPRTAAAHRDEPVIAELRMPTPHHADLAGDRLCDRPHRAEAQLTPVGRCEERGRA